MITKEKLLAGLDELIEVEESAITIYANFSKALLKEATDIEQNKKEKISKLLTRLYRDSARHRELIDKMIGDVTKNTTNEY